MSFFHRLCSRWVASGAVCIVLTLLACSYAVLSPPVLFRDARCVYLGWPMSYVYRANPQDVGIWNGWTEASEFDGWRLFGDILVACVIAWAATALLMYVFARCGRRGQSSLRTMLCLVTCAGLISGAYEYLRREQQHEQEAVAALERIGWRVHTRQGQALPEWIFRLLCDVHLPGRDVFRRVDSLEWRSEDTALGDPGSDVNAMLQETGDLTSRFRFCEAVTVLVPQLSDDGLATLCEHLPSCAVLELEGSSDITEAGLRHILRAWPDLSALSISGSSISDAGLHLLARESRLTIVEFKRSPGITRKGLLELARMPTLIQLQFPIRFYDDDELRDILHHRQIDWGTTD